MAGFYGAIRWFSGIVTWYYLFVIILLSSLLINVLQVATFPLFFLSEHQRLNIRQLLANTWWVENSRNIESHSQSFLS
jgi:hypothetical protein